MIWFLSFYGLMATFSVLNFFVDMHNANGAPQQCVAVATAVFTLLVPYTALKAFHCWQVIQQNEKMLKLLSARPRA